VIGPPSQVEISTNPEDGQSILIPVPDQIRILRDDIFASSGSPAPAAEINTVEPVQPSQPEDTPELMKAEKARVMIQNGTAIAGLASKTSEMLKSLGVNIVGEDNAERKIENTTIYVYAGKPYTIKFLKDTLKVLDTRIVYRSEGNPSADIEIVLGADWASQQQ
jgi:hypothetical protein